MRNIALLALLAAGVVASAQVIYSEGFESLADGTSLNTYNPGVGTAAPWQANVNVKVSAAEAHTGTKSVTRDYSVNTTGTGGDIWKVLNFSPGTGVVVQTAWVKMKQNVATLSTDQLLQYSMRSYAWNQVDGSNPFVGAIGMFSWQDTEGDDSTRGRCFLGIATTATGYNHFTPANRATFLDLAGWNKVELVMDYRRGIYSGKINGRDIGLAAAWNNASNPQGVYPLADHGMFTMQPLRYKFNGTSYVSDANATDHSPFFDDYKMEVKTAKPITGTIDCESFVGHAGENKVQDLIVTITDSAGNVLEEGTTLTDGTGAFDFSSTLPDGTYNVSFKSFKWLSTGVSNVSISSAGTNVGTVTLRGGDADSNNIIDISDYGILSTAFDGFFDDGSGQSSTNWNVFADFNADGIIDVADYTILSNNFDGVGS